MKTSELQKLQIGSIIQHKHYGKCSIISFVTNFGPVIRPLYYRQRVHLNKRTGMHFNTPLLETSFRLILKNVAS